MVLDEMETRTRQGHQLTRRTEVAKSAISSSTRSRELYYYNAWALSERIAERRSRCREDTRVANHQTKSQENALGRCLFTDVGDVTMVVLMRITATTCGDKHRARNKSAQCLAARSWMSIPHPCLLRLSSVQKAADSRLRPQRAWAKYWSVIHPLVKK